MKLKQVKPSKKKKAKATFLNAKKTVFHFVCYDVKAER